MLHCKNGLLRARILDNNISPKQLNIIVCLAGVSCEELARTIAKQVRVGMMPGAGFQGVDCARKPGGLPGRSWNFLEA
eukprot:1316411-Alexandrium_andersonii.AAC.1